MHDAERILHRSWRFHFSHDRDSAEFVFQRGWLQLIVDTGPLAVDYLLLLVATVLIASYLSIVPALQGLLLVAAGILAVRWIAFAMLALLQERRCQVRLSDGVLEVPVGITRTPCRIPTQSLVDVQFCERLCGQIRIRTTERELWFMLPRVHRCEGRAMAAFLSEELSLYATPEDGHTPASQPQPA
ncbi:MAG: hypothetical protein AAFV53_33670 [Myxococcota bacterium]